MKICKDCKNEFEPTAKKSIFCSSKCRQSAYRKSVQEKLRELDRLRGVTALQPKETVTNTVKSQINDLNNHTNKVEPQKPLGSNKSNYTINNSIPPVPQKSDFKDSFEYAAAKNEWKIKYG